jgi:Rrf2 family protein
MDAKTISSNTNVTLRFTLKIMQKLSACGIVKSYKGVNGGYELQKEPKEISLNDVIEAIDGPVEINKCLDEDIGCTRVDQKAQCVIHAQFDRINRILISELENVTFDQFIS